MLRCNMVPILGEIKAGEKSSSANIPHDADGGAETCSDFASARAHLVRTDGAAVRVMSSVPQSGRANVSDATLCKTLAHLFQSRRTAAGTFQLDRGLPLDIPTGRMTVNGIIYLIGLIVVILAILSFFGLR